MRKQYYEKTKGREDGGREKGREVEVREEIVLSERTGKKTCHESTCEYSRRSLQTSQLCPQLSRSY